MYKRNIYVFFSYYVKMACMHNYPPGAVLQVMQIFMPVTAQLHPKEFPGEHPNDCPRNIKKAE